MNQWISRNGRYLIHRTERANVPGILSRGLLPWDHPENPSGTAFRDPWVPRPGHTYVGTSQRARKIRWLDDPVDLAIDWGGFLRDNPQAHADVNPDEDAHIHPDHSPHAEVQGFPYIPLDEEGDPEDPSPEYHNYGQWADAMDLGSDPQHAVNSLERTGSLAYRGTIPPQYLEQYDPMKHTAPDPSDAGYDQFYHARRTPDVPTTEQALAATKQAASQHRLWWNPGEYGRGFVTPDGTVYTWPEDEMTHEERARAIGLGDWYRTVDGFGSSFLIGPAGDMAGGDDVDEDQIERALEQAAAADPRLYDSARGAPRTTSDSPSDLDQQQSRSSAMATPTSAIGSQGSPPALAVDRARAVADTEEALAAILSSPLSPLPPQEQRLGSCNVSWWEMDPGEVYIHAEGGTPDDRHYASTVVAIELESHGYRRAQFDLDGEEDVEHLGSRRYSSWPDIMAKAKRLIQSGQVQLLRNGFNNIIGHVIGDHGDYETEISRDDPNSRAITGWQCSCPWDQYAWQRTRKWKKFEGRPCAHTLALFWKALSTPLDEQLSEQQAQGLGTGQKLGPPSPSAPGPQAPGLPRSFGPEGDILQGDQLQMGNKPPEALGGPPGPAQAPLAPPPGGPTPSGVIPPFPAEQIEQPWAGPGTTPGGGVSPPGAVSVPGAKPQNFMNPLQSPGTYSHALGLWIHPVYNPRHAGAYFPSGGNREVLASDPSDQQDSGASYFPQLEDVRAANEAVHANARAADPAYNEFSRLDNPGLIEGENSVLDQARQAFATNPHPESVFSAAGHLAHGIASRQAFTGGNRRTARAVTQTFLHNNGYGYVSPLDVEDHHLARALNQVVEKGAHSPEYFADMFRRRAQNRRTTKTAAEFNPPEIVRLTKPMYGIARGPVPGRYGDGGYQEVPAGSLGEVYDVHPDGSVGVRVPLDDSGEHEPFHVESWVEPSDIEHTTQSNAFIRRRSGV